VLFRNNCCETLSLAARLVQLRVQRLVQDRRIKKLPLRLFDRAIDLTIARIATRR
jgi:hypothetical protein